MLSREEKLQRRFNLSAICCKKITSTFFGGAEKEAGKAQARASEAAARLTKEQFEDVKARLDPFITPGAPALQQQAAFAGALGPEEQAAAFEGFQEDPGTQFLREQGLRLIDTSAAATGGLGGGERLRALTEFSQGLALQDLSRRFGQLGAVSGTGLGAAQALGGVSGTAAAGQSQALQAAGAARAGGITGQAAGLRAGIQGTAALLASDVRLKTNIKQIDMLDSGLPWYVWDWTEEALAIVGNQPSEGVLAHEARIKFPHAVIEVDGYLRVNYKEIH